MLLQPTTLKRLLFSTGTLKPSVHTLRPVMLGPQQGGGVQWKSPSRGPRSVAHERFEY